jgi:hypothetical protein
MSRNYKELIVSETPFLIQFKKNIVGSKEYNKFNAMQWYTVTRHVYDKIDKVEKFKVFGIDGYIRYDQDYIIRIIAQLPN